MLELLLLEHYEGPWQWAPIALLTLGLGVASAAVARPSMAGMELVIESLKGAMPALAPGAMAQLGLLGLLVSWRHPALSPRTSEDERPAQ